MLIKFETNSKIVKVTAKSNFSNFCNEYKILIEWMIDSAMPKRMYHTCLKYLVISIQCNLHIRFEEIILTLNDFKFVCRRILSQCHYIIMYIITLGNSINV